MFCTCFFVFQLSTPIFWLLLRTLLTRVSEVMKFFQFSEIPENSAHWIFRRDPKFSILWESWDLYSLDFQRWYKIFQFSLISENSAHRIFRRDSRFSLSWEPWDLCSLVFQRWPKVFKFLTSLISLLTWFQRAKIS